MRLPKASWCVFISTDANPDFTRCRPYLYSQYEAERYAARLMKVVPCRDVKIVRDAHMPDCSFDRDRLWWD